MQASPARVPLRRGVLKCAMGRPETNSTISRAGAAGTQPASSLLRLSSQCKLVQRQMGGDLKGCEISFPFPLFAYTIQHCAHLPGIDSENGQTATACAPIPIDHGMAVVFFFVFTGATKTTTSPQTDARSAATLVGTSCEN